MKESKWGLKKTEKKTERKLKKPNCCKHNEQLTLFINGLINLKAQLNLFPRNQLTLAQSVQIPGKYETESCSDFVTISEVRWNKLWRIRRRGVRRGVSLKRL
jgi:hypothetical protein